MNVNLMFLGVLLLVFGYLIGVKGMIGLVTFLRNRRVSDEKKVASILGGSQVGMGAILVTLGALGFQQDALVVMPMLVVLLVVSVYVYWKYVV